MEKGKSNYDPYQSLFRGLINRDLDINTFEQRFLKLWRSDRDKSTLFDEKFQRIIDRVFTSLDVYDDPALDQDFDENRLRAEIKLLTYIWFGE